MVCSSLYAAEITLKLNPTAAVMEILIFCGVAGSHDHHGDPGRRTSISSQTTITIRATLRHRISVRVAGRSGSYPFQGSSIRNLPNSRGDITALPCVPVGASNRTPGFGQTCFPKYGCSNEHVAVLFVGEYRALKDDQSLLTPSRPHSVVTREIGGM